MVLMSFMEFYILMICGISPQQGTIFNFDDLKLYENENILKTIEDQSFLTEAITDRAINFIEKNKKTPFSIYPSFNLMSLFC